MKVKELIARLQTILPDTEIEGCAYGEHDGEQTCSENCKVEIGAGEDYCTFYLTTPVSIELGKRGIY